MICIKIHPIFLNTPEIRDVLVFQIFSPYKIKKRIIKRLIKKDKDIFYPFFKLNIIMYFFSNT